MNRIKLMNKHFRKNKGKPNQNVTDLINGDFDRALERAHKLLSEKKMAEPILLKTANTDYEDLNYRLTKNGAENEFLVEYNNTLLTAIFLGEEELNYYQTVIDHVTGNINEDIVGEVKYRDVSNTELTINNDRDSKGTLLSKVSLDLHLAGGGLLTFDLRNHYNFNEEKYPDVLTQKEQYIVDIIKRAVNTK